MDSKADLPELAHAGVIVSGISVPRTHQSILAVPPLARAPLLAEENRRCLSAYDFDLQGQSFVELRNSVRSEVILRSVEYTESLTGETASFAASSSLLIVTGHQPELFHAGVWAKNFAVAGISRKAAGTALNLIIDSDTVSSTRIRVPLRGSPYPRIEWVPFDGTRAEQPWEECSVIDAACFESFGSRVQALIRENWNYEPIISRFWPTVMGHSRSSPRMCDCLTAGRTAAERALGIRNLEVPMSVVCSTRQFLWYAAYVMLHLPRLHQIYNDAVLDYRRLHRIRNSTHPVPDLDMQGEWFEVPFWIWRGGDLRRERPYVRKCGSEIELRDRRGWSVRLPISFDRSLEAGVDALADLAKTGLRIRTRALTTTLFARLFLSDLFVHGIGGAKYDEMTDAICNRFFGIEAPGFATVSATVHLPLQPPFPSSDLAMTQLQHSIRDCTYNPDRQILDTDDSEVRNLVEEKKQLLIEIAGRRPTRQEHRRLESTNVQLSVFAEDVRQSLLQQQEIARKQSGANALFSDREYSWCLHPESEIRTVMEREFL